MKKKFLIIGIVALVAVLAGSSLGYVYMSGMMVAPDNDYYTSYEFEEENKLPTASCSASPTFGTEPLTVSFQGSGNDNDGSISSYQWNFGDGSTSNEQNPIHTFNIAGTFTVSVTVTDNEGATDYDAIKIIVYPLENQKPEASITANPTSGNAPLTVEFSGYGTDSDGSIVSYHWDFDDGGTSILSSTSHTFNQKGIYTVTLTVTDDDGLYGDDKIYIEVFGPTILELNPTEDSYIELDKPDLNHGNDGSLRTYYYNKYFHNEHISFLKFDISQIEPSATINKAILKLYANYISTPGTIDVHRCSDNSWSEDIITWNNAPSYTTDSEDSNYINSDRIWLEWDVTDYMTDTIPYNRMITFVLDINGDEGSVSFDSKDYLFEYRFPILEIEYE